jgi:hypothetical protein
MTHTSDFRFATEGHAAPGRPAPAELGHRAEARLAAAESASNAAIERLAGLIQLGEGVK